MKTSGRSWKTCTVRKRNDINEKVGQPTEYNGGSSRGIGQNQPVSSKFCGTRFGWDILFGHPPPSPCSPLPKPFARIRLEPPPTPISFETRSTTSARRVIGTGGGDQYHRRRRKPNPVRIIEASSTYILAVGELRRISR